MTYQARMLKRLAHRRRHPVLSRRGRLEEPEAEVGFCARNGEADSLSQLQLGRVAYTRSKSQVSLIV